MNEVANVMPALSRAEHGGRALQLLPARFLAGVLALMALLLGLISMPARALSDPNVGPGGPILVLTSASAPYSTYYAEILRAEGLNQFAMADVSSLSAASLAPYDVVILPKMSVTASQRTTLRNWVQAGGNLIAMSPGSNLYATLGLSAGASAISDRYFQVDTSQSPGLGIVNQTIQFHGAAKRLNLNGATSLATLYSTATAATAYPALTLYANGAGSAAAFTFDVATSIVYTRQGNPAWAATERDGFAPIRSDDKFYGAAAGDVKADWVDLTKAAIPQADELQRLFANLVLHMNGGKKPLPRFWYFPHGHKAVIVMTGDDHGNNGTAGRFDTFLARSPAGCSLVDWECIRGTSYIYTSTPMSNSEAASYDAQGFEVGIHISTNCADYTAASLETFYEDQLAAWQAKYASLPAPITQRHHCIAWSDWTSAASVQYTHGMRLDTSYYFWPPGWVNNQPGIFTGSAMPMRFADLGGNMVDVYMAATQMTDESGQSYPYTVDTLLDRAIGPEGYYGAYVVNAHTDVAATVEADTVVTSALDRGVPVISSRQLLTWVDGRNDSYFGALAWTGSALNFTVYQAAGANGLQGMVPTHFDGKFLTALARGTTSVPYATGVVKGVEYAFFDAASGTYSASYGSDTSAPSVLATSPASGAVDVAADAIVSATFSEAIAASTLNGSTFTLRDSGNVIVPAVLSYDASTLTAVLQPSSPLIAGAAYTANLAGGSITDLAGNPMAGSVSWGFTTKAAVVCPCNGLGTGEPSVSTADSDTSAVELGVKFRSDQNGLITGVRFYKSTSANGGTHIGNLWTASGELLATAVFTSETGTGWQEATFATPVPIVANTVYVASYFAPQGRYAYQGSYFASVGVDNPPLHLLRNGESGGNGVYAYGATSRFPSGTYNSTNYWVDVSFVPSGTSDTTPPTVTARTPADGATNVAVNSAMTVTFSEPVDSTTVGTATIQLRTGTGALVASTVSYDAGSSTATLVPTADLLPSTTYTLTAVGGTADPRVLDLAGNALAASSVTSFTTAAAASGCGTASNAVEAENCLVGNLPAEWDISGAGDPTIQGYATEISVQRGNPVVFKVDTNASNYRFDIYRMGYYGGRGARKIATVLPSASLPQAQPACLDDLTTGLVDCGNWSVSGSWTVPATAVSGIYFAKLVRADTGGASHIVFVVRDDTSTSDLLFQTSDTTWQAYNNYGGNSLYTGAPAGRAYKVSYNRPFNTRAVDNGQDWVFNAEYPMVRWLEANGYDVSYVSGIDSDRSGTLLRNHRVFLSVGHDEYWSAAQRSNVEAARDAGVHLAFFSGNEVFWKTRWEPSIDGSATPYRTLVSYKETHANAKIDPTSTWTGTWRDPRFSPPADGGRPENALTGTLFMANDVGTPYSIEVPAADGKMRFWRNTTVASLTSGQVATLPVGTLGYEWDVDLDNGFRPSGLIRLSSVTLTMGGVLQDFGSNYGAGTLTHSLTQYRHSSGALVFGAGTIQWSWGLDANHDRAGTATDVRMQQATVNLLADMGAQPATLQSGLVPATASSDGAAPTSVITAPTASASLPVGSPVVVSGTASDAGGGAIGGIEVSVDGGISWRRADGRANWSYTWTPTSSGSVTILSRAADDSGNVESPSAGVTVTVGGAATCPCSVWPASAVPGVVSDSDTGSVNLGVKFTASQAGYITGIRFYKGPSNTGTHIGALWNSSGQLLASATFTGETASGWQQVDFPTPVPVEADTVYIASYLAPNGRYSGDNNYFASGVDSGPLHLPASADSGGNGVYLYGSSLGFPASSWAASNYWVDVVYMPAP